MMGGFRRILGAVILLAATLPSAYAEDALVALVIEDGGSEAERAAAEGGYTDTLVSEAERVLRLRGMEIVKSSGETAPGEKPRWSIRIHCALENGMLSWWFELRDDQRGTLITADAFSAAAGLSVRDLLADSMENMAAHWERSRAAPAPSIPITYRLTFISWDEGASVILGSTEGGGQELCKIKEKVTEAEYIALVKDRPIRIEVQKEGYWTAVVELPKGPTEEPILLPRLMKRTTGAFMMSWSPSRGTGFTLSYRYYPAPDTVFILTTLSPWRQDDGLPGSSPINHLGSRVGAGFYLPFRKTANYRMSLGAGMEMIWTHLTGAIGLEKATGLDILIDPLTFTFDFHLPRLALVLEQRFPFSVGGGTGFIDRGWVQNGSGGMLHASLGVMYKW